MPERLNGQVKIFKFILLQVHIFKSVPNGRDSINAMQNYQENSSDYNSNEDVPPKPPPRPKRKSRMKIKNLSLEEKGSAQKYSHKNDILFRTDSKLKLRSENNLLKG